MAAGDAFTAAQRHEIDKAIRDAETLCRFEFSVYVGRADGEPGRSPSGCTPRWSRPARACWSGRPGAPGCSRWSPAPTRAGSLDDAEVELAVLDHAERVRRRRPGRRHHPRRAAARRARPPPAAARCTAEPAVTRTHDEGPHPDAGAALRLSRRSGQASGGLRGQGARDVVAALAHVALGGRVGRRRLQPGVDPVEGRLGGQRPREDELQRRRGALGALLLPDRLGRPRGTSRRTARARRSWPEAWNASTMLRWVSLGTSSRTTASLPGLGLGLGGRAARAGRRRRAPGRRSCCRGPAPRRSGRRRRGRPGPAR